MSENHDQPAGDLKHLVDVHLDTMGRWSTSEETKRVIKELRARLERATVTEPGPVGPWRRSDLARLLHETKDPVIAELCQIVQRLQGWTSDEPEYSDAELRDQLAKELGKGWEVCDAGFTACWILRQVVGPKDQIAYPTYTALRRPNGIKDCAQALRLLAGVE